LANRFPTLPRDYASSARDDDDALMRRAWAAALTGLDGARPPDRDRPLRVITQRRVQGDGVSEPGLSGDQVATLFEGFASAAIVQVDDLLDFDPALARADGTPTILVSNIRARYGERAQAVRPDLHIVLWNPFQALDFAVPSVITWGYADGALEALRAWLEGRACATGRSPVPLR
jgi:beta-N-acetylhexosaminidase